MTAGWRPAKPSWADLLPVYDVSAKTVAYVVYEGLTPADSNGKSYKWAVYQIFKTGDEWKMRMLHSRMGYVTYYDPVTDDLTEGEYAVGYGINETASVAAACGLDVAANGAAIVSITKAGIAYRLVPLP